MFLLSVWWWTFCSESLFGNREIETVGPKVITDGLQVLLNSIQLDLRSADEPLLRLTVEAQPLQSEAAPKSSAARPFKPSLAVWEEKRSTDRRWESGFSWLNNVEHLHRFSLQDVYEFCDPCARLFRLATASKSRSCASVVHQNMFNHRRRCYFWMLIASPKRDSQYWKAPQCLEVQIDGLRLATLSHKPGEAGRAGLEMLEKCAFLIFSIQKLWRNVYPQRSSDIVEYLPLLLLLFVLLLLLCNLLFVLHLPLLLYVFLM